MCLGTEAAPPDRHRPVSPAFAFSIFNQVLLRQAETLCLLGTFVCDASWSCESRHWGIVMAARKSGKMTVEEAGRKGGEATSSLHGRGFYEQIGHKGGEVRRGQLGREGYSALGRKGGEATSVKHGSDFYAQIGKKGGESVSRDRAHMSQIGRKGGEVRAEHRNRDR